MKFYIAYGSNLSVEQMEFRCPGARVVGMAALQDWKLAFGRHATIEPCPGRVVPVLIWEITDADEKSLDKYEGYPKYYYKENLDVVMTDFDGRNPRAIEAMVYIMTEIQKDGFPSELYVNTIVDGYRNFGFNMDVLHTAIMECLY